MKLADFESHHIEGFANMGGGHFKAPLFTHVRGNLYQGGCPDPELPEEFDNVISLYPWGHYSKSQKVVYLEAYLYDSHNVPDAGQLDMLSDVALSFIDKGKTLIHCQAGLNRSALLTVCVLEKMGMATELAIKMLRDNRCKAVLCNEAFVKWLIEGKRK